MHVAVRRRDYLFILVFECGEHEQFFIKSTDEMKTFTRKYIYDAY